MKLIYVVVDDRDFINQRLNLALAAKRAGMDVVIASEKSDLSAHIKNHGFRYIDTKIKRGGLNLISEVRAILSLVSIFKNEEPDIVHNISIKSVIYGSIAAKLVGVPKIFNLINGLGYAFTEDKSLKRKFLKLLVTIMYFFALRFSKAVVIFQNVDDKNYFVNNKLVSKERSHVILGSGVDVDYYKPININKSEGKIKLLYFGRMLWDKGLLNLVEASSMLKARNLDFSLIFAGEPDPQNQKSIDFAILKNWENKGLIKYAGYQTDIKSLLSSIDIVVLPTFYREGVPLSLIEAASMEKPIVTTDMPGCREIVKHNVNGLLVPVKNSELLANELETLILKPEMRIKMGVEGRRLVLKKFSSKIVNEQTLNLYFDQA